MMPLGTKASVLEGCAAFNLAPGGWIGAISGDRYCKESRATSGEALADAKEMFERVG
jgi:hypothetical protein